MAHRKNSSSDANVSTVCGKIGILYQNDDYVITSSSQRPHLKSGEDE